MSEKSAPQPPKRGDAAYRAQKEAIQARNDAARKAGREFRQGEEKKAAIKRAEVEKAESADLRHTFGGNTAH